MPSALTDLALHSVLWAVLPLEAGQDQMLHLWHLMLVPADVYTTLSLAVPAALFTKEAVASTAVGSLLASKELQSYWLSYWWLLSLMEHSSAESFDFIYVPMCLRGLGWSRI